MKNRFDFCVIGFNCLLAALLLATTLSSFGATRGLKIVGDVLAASEAEVFQSADKTYRALIIGNDSYRDPENLWQPLKRAVSDARAVEKLLIEHYGFADVVRVENASRRQLLHALRDFSKRVDDNDSVLVYYAGHGFLDQYTNKGYWVPVDAQGTDHATFVRNSTIRDELSDIAMKAKHTLLISDSCFSGTLLKPANRGLRVADNSHDYLQAVDNKKSVQILTAGGVEYVDDDYRASGHSPFTYFLKNELENNPYPVITASELSRKIQLAVSNNVEQEPQIGVLQGAGDELGEFLFIKVNLEVSGVPKERVKVKVNVISDTDAKDAAAHASAKKADAAAKTTTDKKTKKDDIVLPIQSF